MKNHGIRKVDEKFTNIIRKIVTKLNINNITVHAYGVDAVRGFARYKNKTITIPIFAKEYGGKYLTYYCAHELAHLYANRYTRKTYIAPHGPEFMNWLKKLCPKNCIHYELEFKPKIAKHAGINKKGHT